MTSLVGGLRAKGMFFLFSVQTFDIYNTVEIWGGGQICGKPCEIKFQFDVWELIHV